MVSKRVYENVLENTQKLLKSCTVDGITYYEGNFSWNEMNEWYKKNCK